ncbi:hypothetical protein SCHIN_v1c04170 [Spiroplasma chinense]|uniref:Uncharacterized protein n=1 Tax=Spiroplasma chinense TaxID=216932 RepID=A0A5B9Y3I3_9MOLU|nr:hypothetical protein [Spiroplasma chinense]QEH61614.1 hypothetical protein SCHIN_v1c04170 [Spiroplasma chinense]
MSQLSRMERNKALHNRVQKEIAYKKQNQDEKSIINATFERLKKIDRAFFQQKLEIFDKKHEIEKPYLDKDRSNLLISEEIKYDLRREIEELKKIKSKSVILDKEKTDEDKEEKVLIRDQKYIDYMNSVDKNEGIFLNNLNKVRSKQTRKGYITVEDISMTSVQKKRSEDNRSIIVMLDEVSRKTDAGRNTMGKAWSDYSKKQKFKWTIWFLTVLLLIMTMCIVIPFFF